jgi:multidrug resistance efflux pump
MEIQMEAVEDLSIAGVAERLAAAADALEQAAARIAGVQLQASAREAELETQLAEAQSTIATLKAGGRKTTGAVAGTLLAKEGHGVDVGALDAAMSCLSLEQRIAVKAGLLRSGLVG